ncbi:MAG: PASTA domain-containing protein [Candidatus Eisenbacteria bacterium]|nr:PASTA domain-containing protein [Candidatus Eisenbacteria bacterium]
MRRDGDRRLAVFLGLVALGFLVLIARAAQFAILEHSELERIARAQQTDQVDLPAKRGPILDRHGRTLSCTLENPSLAVRLSDPQERRRILEASLRAGACTPARARALAGERNAGFAWVNRRWVSEQALQRLPAGLAGLEQHSELKRFYPAGAVAPQLLGLVGTDGVGLSGLEWQYQEHLAGRPGRLLQFVTGGGRPQNAPPARVLEPPRDGGGLLLTIDQQIQEIVRHRLRQGAAAAEAREAFAIVLDPVGGEIRALVELPEFDPLCAEALDPARLHLGAVMDQYEPGSVLKIVPFCAAFESGLVTPADTFYCHEGERCVHGCCIRDLHPYGFLTVAEILIKSSNIGAGRLAECCGWQRVCAMAQSLGFGTPTGIAFGGEASGHLPHPLRKGWSERSLITMAYGQEIAATGVQVAAAFAAIANGGRLMRPRLVSAFLDAGGEIERRTRPEMIRRALSPETAETMRLLLRDVVAHGTGRAAEVPHCPPAGKTGTAQWVDPETGTYSPDEHLLSFAGFAPHDDPRCVCLVMLRTRADVQAGGAAAPIFGRIIEDLTWILQRDRWARTPLAQAVERPIVVPDVRGLRAEAARQALRRNDLIPVLEGPGDCVTACRPAAYALVQPGSVIKLRLGDDLERGTVQVPDVKGLSLRQAIALLAAADLEVAAEGGGWVVQQHPAAGTRVAGGTRCRLRADAAASQARADALRRRELVCRAR